MLQMANSKKESDVNNNIKQGVIGGVVGACLGVTGLGVATGLAHANKDKIKKYWKENVKR